ncbi:MAG: transposase [Rhodospirillales bacterium]|nr:transposase [Rhodospirillales bacterium]
MAFPIRDRYSWRRVPGFRIGESTPDHKTIWRFRERLTPGGCRQGAVCRF